MKIWPGQEIGDDVITKAFKFPVDKIALIVTTGSVDLELLFQEASDYIACPNAFTPTDPNFGFNEINCPGLVGLRVTPDPGTEGYISARAGD